MNRIKDFLKGREQRVVVNNECSDLASVVSGIPQGSVLGQTLFTFLLMTSQLIPPQMPIILRMTQNYIMQLILIIQNQKFI